MLTVQRPPRRVGARAGGRRARRGEPGALGAHLRARGSDPLALRRGADAEHRDPAGQRRQAACLHQVAGPPQPGGARLRHRLQPRQAAQGTGRRGPQAGVPAFRGALLDAVHRDHREGLLAPRQRAVRGAPAGDRGAAPARAAGPRGARPRGDRRDDLLRRRRHGQHPQRSRRAAGRPRLPPRAVRGGGRADPRRGTRPRRRRQSLHPLASRRSPVGRWPTRWSRRAAGLRRPGSRSSGTPAASATSSS